MAFDRGVVHNVEVSATAGPRRVGLPVGVPRLRWTQSGLGGGAAVGSNMRSVSGLVEEAHFFDEVDDRYCGLAAIRTELDIGCVIDVV